MLYALEGKCDEGILQNVTLLCIHLLSHLDYIQTTSALPTALLGWACGPRVFEISIVAVFSLQSATSESLARRGRRDRDLSTGNAHFVAAKRDSLDATTFFPQHGCLTIFHYFQQ